jgi:hypothetical protein
MVLFSQSVQPTILSQTNRSSADDHVLGTIQSSLEVPLWVRPLTMLFGAIEIVTKQYRSHVMVHQDGNHRVSEDGEVEVAPITKVEANNVSRTITNQTLRTIGICYRDLDITRLRT